MEDSGWSDSMITSDSDSGSCCNVDDEKYHKEYVLKHINIAFEKFGDVKNDFIRYLIIIWYLLDIVSLGPENIIESLTITIFDNAELSVLTQIIRTYNRYNNYCFGYKMHDIKSNLQETLNIEKDLSKYLRAPLCNSFLPILKEVKYNYIKHNIVYRNSVKHLFRCLRNIIDLD
jgi:hypothetical protein